MSTLEELIGQLTPRVEKLQISRKGMSHVNVKRIKRSQQQCLLERVHNSCKRERKVVSQRCGCGCGNFDALLMKLSRKNRLQNKVRHKFHRRKIDFKFKCWPHRIFFFSVASI